MSCGVCDKLGRSGVTRIKLFTPPINFGGKEVYMWQGECETCGAQTEICLTCAEVKERMRVGWYWKEVE